ncbi:alpha,alpha-phosphotrehalase [Paenibacillus antarcticus]|uniref:Alpha,alpha-phosphotrehalase n=1 Tax=Paenibacillus antarcticus TaxID=253703 RepID=A0A168JC90_9BACL|nr:alpha,alpha-phosphotrehalase [Paenibacillus antarcticus]OAB40434.1 alpha,alpha-phosphotrehalase [Paenibacillus antarcticus]
MLNASKEQWWRKSTVYQVYPKSFKDTTGSGTGDIKGLIGKLDYLQELGIDIVWLQPIYVSPQNDNGYDVADYRQIDPDFGTMEDFEELMKELKKRGMHLMTDIVVNHSSTEHQWFQEAKKSKDNPYRNYYIWRDPAPGGGVPNNWQSKFGGSAWQFEETTGQYFLTLFDKTQADLNWEYEKVRQEVADLMIFWVEKGVKGFRMDVINLISKDQNFPDDDGSIAPGDGRKFYTDGSRVHEYIKELYAKVFGPYDLVTVGEMSSTTLEHCIRYSNPQEEEFSMTFNFHHLKVDYKNGQKWELKPYDFEELKGLFTKWQTGMQSSGGWNALFWNNHDQPRALSRFANDGEYRTESAKMLAITLHGLQGTPYVYQGEEIGMPNPDWHDISEFNDIESTNMYRILQERGLTSVEAMTVLRERSRDNSRTPMQWDDTENAGFTSGKPWLKLDERYPEINVKREQENADSILSHYKKLIQLRKQESVITEGFFKRLDDQHPEIFAYARMTDSETLIIVSNFSSKQTSFTFAEDFWTPRAEGRDTELLIGNTHQSPSWGKTLELMPYASYMWIIR